MNDTGSWRDIAAAGVFYSLDHSLLWTATTLAGERLAAGSNDARLLADFRAVFGGDEPAPGEAPEDATVTIRATTESSVPGFGYAFVARRGVAVDVADYLIGVDRPDCPYQVLEVGSGWRALGDRVTGEPVILYRGPDIVFRITDSWTIVVLSLVFRAVFGVHQEAILFHSGSVAVGSAGVMLAGPPRSGKSTLSLALAARGHHFLSDEIAWYLPESHELADFRRPVGVREGLRSRAIDDALVSMGSPRPQWNDSVRLPIDSLIRQEAPRAFKLSAIFLLRGFAESPRVRQFTPTLADLPMLQLIPVSLMNTPAGRRMIQMTRLLAAVRMYDLHLGHPDDTAQLLEEVVTGHVNDSQ